MAATGSPIILPQSSTGRLVVTIGRCGAEAAYVFRLDMSVGMRLAGADMEKGVGICAVMARDVGPYGQGHKAVMLRKSLILLVEVGIVKTGPAHPGLGSEPKKNAVTDYGWMVSISPTNSISVPAINMPKAAQYQRKAIWSL